MRTTAPAADPGTTPQLESDSELRARLIRTGGHLVALGWALALGGALAAAGAPPAGDAALLLVAGGLLCGIFTAALPTRRRARMTTEVVGAALVLHVVAIAVALDSTGAVAAGASVLAAAYAGAVVPGRVASRALALGAAVAPVLVASLATGRGEDVLPTAVALAPVALVVGLVAAELRAEANRRESVLRALVRRDPLTGVRNYRGLHEQLAETVARDPQRFALLTMDVDEFKAVNDRYGHLEGDRLLREVSRALADNVRGKDLVARQGGDEFAVLAPETGKEGAQVLAARIAKAIGEIELIENQPLSASIGIAVYPDDGTTVDELLARSDDALRELKVTRRVDVVPG